MYPHLQRKSVFEWFGAMLSLIPGEALKPYLKPALGILYRAAEDTAISSKELGMFLLGLLNEWRAICYCANLTVIPVDELRITAKEIMELLQKQVGTVTYLEVYNEVHSQVQEVRFERKLKRKIQVSLQKPLV
jgi:hypothetical protein